MIFVLIKSILVISGQRKVDNEMMCLKDPCLLVEIFSSAGLEPSTTRSVGQQRYTKYLMLLLGS